MSAITSEVVCAELRGEAARLAEAHNGTNPDRAAEYRGLEFEPVSSSEFRAKNPNGEGNDLLLLVTDTVEYRMALEFVEHWENGSEALITWS